MAVNAALLVILAVVSIAVQPSICLTKVSFAIRSKIYKMLSCEYSKT